MHRSGVCSKGTVMAAGLEPGQGMGTGTGIRRRERARRGESEGEEFRIMRRDRGAYGRPEVGVWWAVTVRWRKCAVRRVSRCGGGKL